MLGNTARLSGKVVACGFPRGMAQPYPEGESVASVAAKNCWGIGVIQRDFMSYAKDQIIETTRPILIRVARLSHQPGDHRAQIQMLLERAGLLAANCIKRAIRDGNWEPNSDHPMSAELHAEIERSWGLKIPRGMSYRAAKLKYHHSDKPLIDTAHMINAATYVVRDR